MQRSQCCFASQKVDDSNRHYNGEVLRASQSLRRSFYQWLPKFLVSYYDEYESRQHSLLQSAASSFVHFNVSAWCRWACHQVRRTGYVHFTLLPCTCHSCSNWCSCGLWLYHSLALTHWRCPDLAPNFSSFNCCPTYCHISWAFDRYSWLPCLMDGTAICSDR